MVAEILFYRFRELPVERSSKLPAGQGLMIAVAISLMIWAFIAWLVL
jgi:hypothetical protein